jgi:hypothetical protein
VGVTETLGGSFFRETKERPSKKECPAMIRRMLLAAALLGLTTCDSDSPSESGPSRLEAGEWGGENAGVIVDASKAHVHVGCTFGDFPVPGELDAESRFSVTGSYLLRAFPVAVGPTMPATFAGQIRNGTLTMTVAVNDTIQGQIVVLGPVTVVYGREAQMGPCPICEMTMDREVR